MNTRQLIHKLATRDTSQDEKHNVISWALAFVFIVVVLMSFATDKEEYTKYYQTAREQRGLSFVGGPINTCGCGICTATTFLNKFGYNVSLADIIDLYNQMYPNQSQLGTASSFIKKICNEYNLSCVEYETLTKQQTINAIDSGSIVVLLIPENTGKITSDYKHYVYIEGYHYDKNNNLIFDIFNPETSKKINKIQIDYDVVKCCKHLWIVSK